MIHEVDQLLEKLVKRDALNGSSVELVFDAPTKDWVARRNGPAVDLYLYDIREDLQRRVPAWEDRRDGDGKINARTLPPRRFKLSYLVTAWTQRPEDEHRLLSALLSAFIANPMIKPDQLEGTLAEPDLPVYIDVGQPPSQDRSLADVWSALGGELKPSLDVVVVAPIMVNRHAPIGPLVLQGPSLGLTAAGATEIVSKRRGPGAGGDVDDDGQPVELVPASASGKKPMPGMAIRVRGLRTR
ncbi:MAG: DUF4255 domain-containing protein [Candidatus Limnocylindrales bacterium]